MGKLARIEYGKMLIRRTALSAITIVTFASLTVSAQLSFDTTHYIPEVIISSSRQQQFIDDTRTDVFTSEVLKTCPGESLSQFLAGNTALNIRSYGSGGAIANVSLRGSSTSQVQVNWNGFPINSVTLGSCDFSMIPAGGFDRISVVYSAPGALYGSGTLGGAINLDNDLKPGKAFGVSAATGWESLKTFNGSSSINIGNNILAWKGNIWGSASDNEFTYYDYIKNYTRKQTDGNWNDAGTIQQIVFRLSPTSTLETGLWYQVKKYNIPSRIGSVSFESQKDSTLKFFAAYKKSGNRWGMQIKTALFNDFQRYTMKPSGQATTYSIDSRISSHQFFGEAGFRYYPWNHISIDAGFTGSFQSADVSAYGETKSEKGITAFTGARYQRNRLILLGHLRKEFNSGFSSSVLPSFGLSWTIVPDKYILRFNISKKFRKPSFNDLFWMPGGNMGLQPESGYSAEAGSAMTIFKNESLKITADIGSYISKTNNMIVWRPSGAYWTALNYQSVKSAGTDGSLNADLTIGKLKYHSSFMIMLNKSRVIPYGSEDQEKMLYSPQIITSWGNRFSAGIFDLIINHHFSADRYYDTYSRLESYHTIDIKSGIRIPVNKGRMDFHISVNNLTNSVYEMIRLYPMPGRYWSVKISYSFLTNDKTKI